MLPRPSSERIEQKYAAKLDAIQAVAAAANGNTANGIQNNRAIGG